MTEQINNENVFFVGTLLNTFVAIIDVLQLLPSQRRITSRHVTRTCTISYLEHLLLRAFFPPRSRRATSEPLFSGVSIAEMSTHALHGVMAAMDKLGMGTYVIMRTNCL